MLSTLAAKIRALQAEAKANFNTNTIYFLDAPHMDHLGFKVKVLGPNKQQQESLARLKNSVFYHDIVHASSLVDDKLLQIQSLIDDFIEQKLDLKVHLCSADLIMKDKDSAAYLRLLEINSFLAQQSKLKNSIYFLNTLKATLQLYPLAYFLSEQGFNSEDLNLEHESCQNFNPKQKEQIRALSQLLDTKHEGCNFILQIAHLTRALCQQSDLGMIYACSLLGLEQILQSYQSLKRFEPELTIELMITKLAQLYSNDHKATILSLHEFLTSTSYKSFKLSKDNKIERYDFLSQSANKTPKQPTIKAPHKTLVLTNVANNTQAIIDDSSYEKGLSSESSSITLSPTELNTSLFISNNTQLQHSLILETATNSQILAAKQDLSSFKATSMTHDPVVAAAFEDKTTTKATQKSAKAPAPKAQAKGLVLTNAATQESSLAVTTTAQQLEPVNAQEPNVTAQELADTTNLPSESDLDTPAHQDNNKSTPTTKAPQKSTKVPAPKAQAKGLVLTNAATQESSLAVTTAAQQLEPINAQEPNVTAQELADTTNLPSESDLDTLAKQDNNKSTTTTKASQKSTKAPAAKAQAKGLVLTNAATQESSLAVTTAAQQLEPINAQEPNVTAQELADTTNLPSENSLDTTTHQDNNKSTTTTKATQKSTKAPAPKAKEKGLVLTNAATQESSLAVTTAAQQLETINAQEPNVSDTTNLPSENSLDTPTHQDNNKSTTTTKATQKSTKAPAAKAQANDLALTNAATQESSLAVTTAAQQLETINAQEPNVSDTTNLPSENSLDTPAHQDNNKSKITTKATQKSTKAPAAKAQANDLALTNAASLAVTNPDNIENKQDLNNESPLLQKPISSGGVSNEVIEMHTTDLIADPDSKTALKHDLSTILDAKDEQASLEHHKGIDPDVTANAAASKEVITKNSKKRKVKAPLSAVTKNKEQSLDNKPITNGDEQTTAPRNLGSGSQAQFDNAVTNKSTVCESSHDAQQETKESEDKGADLSGKKPPSENNYSLWHRFSSRNISAREHLNKVVISSKDSLATKAHLNQELSFDPIAGTYIYEDQSNSNDASPTYGSNNLDFATKAFDDDFMQDIMARQATDFLDSKEPNTTELDWDKLLECDDELMRLKYIMLYAQSMLLNQQQYEALLKPSAFSSHIPLRQALSSLKTLENYKETMVYLLSNHNRAMTVLNQHLSKFKYYRRTLGTTWQMSANNTKGPYSSNDKASFEQLDNSSSINFILSCLLLCGSNILQLSNECLLESAYSACQIEFPI